jgi:hypothetical protein
MSTTNPIGAAAPPSAAALPSGAAPPSAAAPLGATIRPALPGDIAAIEAVSAANGEPLVLPPGSRVGYVEHLLVRGIVHVAEQAGTVVGYGAAIDIPDGSRQLTDLFIDPAVHGRGLGGRLLDAVLAGATARTTCASADPRALPLYLRAGMRAWWPLVDLVLGQESVDRLRRAASETGMRVAVVDVDQAADEEQRLSGVDRRADYPFWGGRAGAVPFVVNGGGASRAVGIACTPMRGPGIRLVRMVGVGEADPEATLVATIAALAEWATDVTGGVRVAVPGPHPAIPALLRAGARMVDHNTMMASDPAFIDPVRVLPDPALR